jgi:multiple sugar transport system substrate-binding protein
MRNWPYALAELEKEGSPVRGRVAISLLPSASGDPGHGTLGGFTLVVNAHAPEANREAALELVRHLTSTESALVLAEAYGRSPARRAPYDSVELKARAPGVAALSRALELAWPRPVTPFYPLYTDVMQGELSAAIAGIRTPEEALARVRASAERLAGRR